MNRIRLEAAAINKLLSYEIDKKLVRKGSFIHLNHCLDYIKDNDGISFGIFNDKFESSEYISLIKEVHSSSNYSNKEIVAFVKKANKQLFIKELYNKVSHIAANEEIMTYEDISSILKPYAFGSSEEAKVKSSMELLDEIIEDLKANKEELSVGLRSSLITLNTILGGCFRKGNNYVIAARPGTGKTTLACQLILDFSNPALNKEKPLIVFWTLEIPSKSVIMKMLSNMINVPFNDILLNKDSFGQSMIDRVLEHKNFLKDMDVMYIDTVTNANDIYQKGVDLHNNNKNRTIVHVLDHTTLASNDATDQRQVVVDVLRVFQQLKKETESINIIVSHVKRTADDKERKSELYEPRISDLVWSSEIEQIADVIMFLHEPFKFNIPVFCNVNAENMIFGLIKKNRYNRLGVIPFKNELKYNKLGNYEPIN